MSYRRTDSRAQGPSTPTKSIARNARDGSERSSPSEHRTTTPPGIRKPRAQLAPVRVLYRRLDRAPAHRPRTPWSVLEHHDRSPPSRVLDRRGDGGERASGQVTGEGRTMTSGAGRPRCMPSCHRRRRYQDAGDPRRVRVRRPNDVDRDLRMSVRRGLTGLEDVAAGVPDVSKVLAFRCGINTRGADTASAARHGGANPRSTSAGCSGLPRPSSPWVVSTTLPSTRPTTSPISC